jgi:hypothetical protein
MTYAFWSVVYGDVPTAEEWSQLGLNDAALRDGSGLAITTNNSIPALALATNAITLGYAQITSNFTTSSLSVGAATGLSAAVTIPAGGRRTEIIFWTGAVTNNTNSDGTNLEIWDGTVGSGTRLLTSNIYQPTGAQMQVPVALRAVVSPSAGSKTYNVGISAVTGGTASILANATSPAYIQVKAA